MARRLSASFVSAIYETLLRSFWRRKTLARFLRQSGGSESFLGTWMAEESKREFLDRLFARLTGSDRGQDLLAAMARDLVQQESFPDLAGWEDSEEKIGEARQAVDSLRIILAKLSAEVQNEREQQEAQTRFRSFQEELRRSRENLESLEKRLGELAKQLGSQTGLRISKMVL